MLGATQRRLRGPSRQTRPTDRNRATARRLNPVLPRVYSWILGGPAGWMSGGRGTRMTDDSSYVWAALEETVLPCRHGRGGEASKSIDRTRRAAANKTGCKKKTQKTAKSI
jgi:hypothetical protein